MVSGTPERITPCPGLAIPSREAVLSADTHAISHWNQDSS